MTAYRSKILRDFWHARTRSILVVIAIAIGIAAFAAVMSSYGILKRELTKGYLATNPASLTLLVDKVDDALIAAVAADSGVKAVEARRTLGGRARVGPAEWRNLTLFVLDDFANVRVSKPDPERGAWPPAPGEILIERDAMRVARTTISSPIVIKLARGEERTLRVSGTVHDVGQAQARMENGVYGYITRDTLAQLGEEPYLDRLYVLVSGDSLDERHVRNVGDDLKKLVEGQGYPVKRLDVPSPGKHPHEDIMGLLLLSMAGFGLLALILSGVLVVNLLSALMSSQLREIGIMKAIGGTRRQIARLYLGHALLLGLVAILLALPVGLIGGRALTSYLSVFLNFDVSSWMVPGWVYLLIALVGLAVPLLAAAYPVWQGTRVSVCTALADAGVTATTFGAGAFDRVLSKVGGISRPILFAIRNSFRRRARLILTVSTLATSGLFFMAALNVRASMINTLDQLFATRRFDLSLVLGAMYPADQVRRAIEQTPGIVTAEGWIVADGAVPAPADVKKAEGGAASARGLHGGASSGGHGDSASTIRFTAMALPTDTGLLKPNITSGRGLSGADLDVMIVNRALAIRIPQFETGREVTLRVGPEQRAWKIVGVADEPFSPPTAYLPLRYIEERGGHGPMTNSLRLRLERTDAASIIDLKSRLEKNLEREGVRALNSTSQADSRFGFDQHMVMIYVFLIVVSAILAAVGGLGLMTTMTLNVLERRREMGVLRAIGATPRIIWLMITAEACVIGILSWVVATVVAWPVSKAIGNVLLTAMFKTSLNFHFAWRGPLIWLGVSLVLCAFASFLPAWRASSQTVREAIAHQ